MLWPPFVSLAKQSGFGAVFAYPLIIEGAKVGVLSLYQHVEGDLTPLQHDDSFALAETASHIVARRLRLPSHDEPEMEV